MKSYPRVSDYIISYLQTLGVEHFFLVVGGNAMYLNDAVLKSGICYTAFHHEQAAVMAAEAYARLNHRLGCAIVTSGPGATNALTGIAGSFFDSSPILVLSGQPKSTELWDDEMPSGVRQIGTFELNFAQLASSLCIYAAKVTKASSVPHQLSAAVAAATGARPGPALLEIPIDIQGEEIAIPSDSSSHKINFDGLINEGLDIYLTEFKLDLEKAQRPLIVVGHGVRVSNNVEKLKRIVSSIKIPVVTTQLAKDFMPYDHSYFVGHFGIRGDRAGNIAIQSADLILFLGTSLHQQNIGYEPALFAPQAKKYVVELEGSISGKKLPLIANYMDCDLSTFVSKLGLIDIMHEPIKSKWLRNLMVLKKELAVVNEPHKTEGDRINLYHFVEALSNALQGDESIVTDAGLCFYVMGQAFRLKKNQRYVVSGGLGSMGYALAAGIGLSIDSNVVTVVVTGDGSMQMNVQELATIATLNANLKMFVVNNEGYASLRNTQRSFFGLPFIGASSDSGLSMPNWNTLASAYGIRFIQINRKELEEGKITEVLQLAGPVLIEVLCQIDQEVMPGVGNYRDEEGLLRSRALNEMSPPLDGERGEYGLIIN